MIDDPLFNIPITIKGTKGDKGDTGDAGRDGIDGKDGKDGKDGLDGKDGADGTDGVNGKDGKDGRNGTNGRDGKDGVDGEDGLSAYEIWLNQGNNGTEQDFLDSLKGKDGRHTYSTGTGGKFGVLGAGEIGRLNSKDSALTTDDLTVLRSGSLFRISVQDVVSAAKNYRIVSANYTVTEYDCYIEADTSGITITLLTAVGRAGKEYGIDNSSGGNITVNTTSSQTINDELTQIIPPNSNMKVASNGTNWRIK